jgi:hypothetical protein
MLTTTGEELILQAVKEIVRVMLGWEGLELIECFLS